MATIKTLIGNVKGKDGRGYEEVVLYSGACSACISSNVATSTSPMIEMSESVENYSSIRIEFQFFDGTSSGEGAASTSRTFSTEYIKKVYTHSSLVSTTTYGNVSAAQIFGFYDATHLVLMWELYTGVAHNVSYITVTGIKSTTSDDKETGTSYEKYSTTEEVIGTWYDGKPIYRKTIEFSNLSAGESVRAHGLQNIELLMVNKTWSFIIDESNGVTIWQLGNSNENSNFSQYSCNAVWTNASTISIYIGSGLSPKKLIITFEYTKTTD